MLVNMHRYSEDIKVVAIIVTVKVVQKNSCGKADNSTELEHVMFPPA